MNLIQVCLNTCPLNKTIPDCRITMYGLVSLKWESDSFITGRTRRTALW